MTAPSRSLKERFLAAIEVAPENRAAWLERECGADAELRERLSLMLAAHDTPQSLLDRPGHVPPIAGLGDLKEVAPTIDPTAAERPGVQIGPYKLLQQIGEGGMGVVYMAEQEQPVRRRVALKIIKPGMDSRQVIARFEAERQALSLMDHPNIAKVLDAGTTSSGRPFFVMELVKGQPITQYCDEHHLTPRQRLELLLPVCQAIQHAHQKGIIHRDIKPTNILVAEYDNQPVPKVIDFGVAKAISQSLTERTMFTGLGQIVGTLEYMSPEQAKVNQLDIDTRSDIYSLGVLLYELLTGSTPFDKHRLRSAAWDEMLRIIREEEPEKPSTRLESSRHTPCAVEADGTRSVPTTLASIAAQRQTEPARLSKLVRGELDWIVMKALEKDRNRRYETASALAADLQHYLSDEPVVACPPSAGYRFGKYMRRNKGPVLAAIAVIVAMTGGIVGIILGLVRAEAARLRETEQRQIAQQHATRATDNLRMAITAVDEMYSEISENWLRTTPQMQKSRRHILEKALAFYQRFARHNSESSLQFEMALAWRRVGEIKHRFEEHGQSLEALLECVMLLEKLAAESPNPDRIRHELAQAYSYCSKPLEVTGEYTEGEKYARRSVQLAEELVARHRERPEYRATAAFARHQLGHMLRYQGRDAEALEEHLASEAVYSALNETFPQRTSYLMQLAHAHDHIAVLLRDTGDSEGAEHEYRVAIAMLTGALPGAQNNADVIDSPGYLLGVAYRNLGDFLSANRRNEEAESSYRDAIKLVGEQAKAFPDVGHYQYVLGLCYVSQGKAFRAARQLDVARQSLNEASRILDALLSTADRVPSYHRLATEAKLLAAEIERETEPKEKQ